MSNTISVTAGGIDVNSIVSGFMAIDRQPVDRLMQRQSAVRLQSDAVGRLRNSFENLRTSASNLLSQGISRFSSSVSSSAATATMGPGASAGSLSFTVDRLAQAHGLRTANGVASSSAVVTTAAQLAVSTSTTRLGLGAASVGAGVSNGRYTVTVTQSSVGAVKSAASALAGSTSITAGVNDTVELDVNGVARTLSLAAGTYTAAQLDDAVDAAAAAAGAGLSSSLDVTGRLRLTTAAEGSAASIRVTGGTALGALGLATDAVALAGTDGIVAIGDNPAVAVTSAGAGSSPVALTAGGGQLTFDVTGGLRAGTATVAVVSTGDRSLGAVASAISGANVGAGASAVKVAEGNWVLQLNSRSTGADGRLAVGASAFAGLGGLVETSTAGNAQITIGSGPGAYSVTSSTNVFSDVLPGVSLTAVTPTTTPVNVTVGRNESLTADAVKSLVDAVNATIGDLVVQTRYDAKTGKASPLTNDGGIRRLAEEIRSTITSLVGDSTIGVATAIGIDLQRDGTLKFDRTKFTNAMQSDPAAVERFFTRGGSTTASLSFAAATDRTAAGSYAVEVATPATRATTGSILVGGSPAGQRIAVRVGSVTATYDAAPGATPADLVGGLTSALAGAGLRVNVEQSGGGIRLTSADFGAGGNFETNLDVLGAGTWTTSSGTDVVGTIGGATATGVGNRLRLFDTDTSAARGLEVTVGEGATGSLGSVSYSPGIAARLLGLATRTTGEGGALTSSARTFESRIQSFQTQITRYEDRLTSKETSYRRQWSQVQSVLNSMQNQQNWLTGQINSLNGRRS